MEIVKTKNYGNAIILGDGSKYGYKKVQFINTKNVDEFRDDAVRKGEIRDKYAVSYLGVGVIGNIKTRGKYARYYSMWRNMLTRCYKPSFNLAYFGKVTVCDRWKTFEYFYQDIKHIDGWDEEAFNRGDIVLDKDVKQRYSANKIYSPDHCAMLLKSVNTNIQDRQQKKFKAISPQGIEYTGWNISKFAREHNLERRQVSAVLNGRFESTLGWSFQYLYDEEIV